jgi:hypothetical protein
MAILMLGIPWHNFELASRSRLRGTQIVFGKLSLGKNPCRTYVVRSHRRRFGSLENKRKFLVIEILA